MSAVAEPPKTIRAKVSQRLARELPRFFGGLSDCFRELFQNSYRGGAKNVTVSFDTQANQITFRDDSVGCSDPSLILHGGETGWDETKVTEPAGLGCFSLLNPDLFSHVRFSSQRWSFEVYTKDWVDRDIVVNTIPPHTYGFVVNLDLQPNTINSVDGLAYLLAESRDLYPFKVTMIAGSDTERVIPPHVNGKIITTIPTSVGQVHLIDTYLVNNQPKVTWDYRYLKLPSDTFACPELKAGLRDAMRYHVWEVDPKSGVRPKLPDRSALIDDQNLQAACKTRWEEITEYILTTVRENYRRSLNLTLHVMVDFDPPQIDIGRGEYVTGPLQQWIADHWTVIMQALGWRKYDACLVRQTKYHYTENEGIESTSKYRDIYVLGGQPLEDQKVMDVVINHAPLLSDILKKQEYHPLIQHLLNEKDALEEATFVTVPQSNPGDGNRPKTRYLLPASVIRWNTVDLPFLNVYDHEESQSWMVTTLPMEEIHASSVFPRYLVHIRDNSCDGWPDEWYDYDGQCVDDDIVMRDTLLDLADAYNIDIQDLEKQKALSSTRYNQVKGCVDTLVYMKKSKSADNKLLTASLKPMQQLLRSVSKQRDRDIKTYQQKLTQALATIDERRREAQQDLTPTTPTA